MIAWDNPREALNALRATLTPEQRQIFMDDEPRLRELTNTHINKAIDGEALSVEETRFVVYHLLLTGLMAGVVMQAAMDGLKGET